MFVLLNFEFEVVVVEEIEKNLLFDLGEECVIVGIDCEIDGEVMFDLVSVDELIGVGKSESDVLFDVDYIVDMFYYDSVVDISMGSIFGLGEDIDFDSFEGVEEILVDYLMV